MMPAYWLINLIPVMAVVPKPLSEVPLLHPLPCVPHLLEILKVNKKDLSQSHKHKNNEYCPFVIPFGDR
jgi:hypothetical protein